MKSKFSRHIWELENQLGYSFKSSPLQWLHMKMRPLPDREINDGKGRSFFPT